MEEKIRYQGAIIRNNHILMIEHTEHATRRSYWVIPGGRREAGESEEECVRREMKEETGLDVEVMALLVDELDAPGRYNQRRKTYLCLAPVGEPAPGYEPEPEAASVYCISKVKWFDLQDETRWEPTALSDPLTYPILTSIQRALGYN